MTELELLISINESLNHIEFGLGLLIVAAGIIAFAAIIWVAQFFIKT